MLYLAVYNKKCWKVEIVWPYFHLFRFLANLVAVFGEFDISGELESRRSVTKNVRRVIVHRQYDPATFANDLALLELESPVAFDEHIVPICMPRDKEDFTGRMATVSGCGRLKYGGHDWTKLRWLNRIFHCQQHSNRFNYSRKFTNFGCSCSISSKLCINITLFMPMILHTGIRWWHFLYIRRKGVKILLLLCLQELREVFSPQQVKSLQVHCFNLVLCF